MERITHLIHLLNKILSFAVRQELLAYKNPLRAKSQPGRAFSNHSIFERTVGPTRHIHTPQIHIEYTPLHCFIKCHAYQVCLLKVKNSLKDRKSLTFLFCFPQLLAQSRMHIIVLPTCWLTAWGTWERNVRIIGVILFARSLGILFVENMCHFLKIFLSS